MQNIDRIYAPDYLPNVQDMLRMRIMTTGVNETKFKIKDSNFRCDSFWKNFFLIKFILKLNLKNTQSFRRGRPTQ